MLGTILGILWLILKIILWILLGVLSLVLLLILMVLFVPIRYQVEGSKYETIQGKGKVTYLLRLVRAKFHYSPEGYGYKVKILFFTILSEEVSLKKSDEETSDSDVEVDTQDIKEEKPSPIEVSEPVKPQVIEAHVQEAKPQVTVKPEAKPSEALKPKPSTQTKPEVEVKTEPVVEEEASVEKESKKEAKEKAPKKKKKEKKSKDQANKEGESNKDKALRFYGFLREERNVGVLRFILRRLFKAIGSVLPKKFRGKVHFGLDDPAMTAYILGGASLFYPKYKKSLTLTADFETPVIEGEVDVKGYILPCIFVWMLIRILMDGRVRRLIKEVLKKPQVEVIGKELNQDDQDLNR